ncbi:MAG: site-2 protease family protein [Clostridia bacterium]|nr:site-2 protease family protein [Clostridia bacterium]
MVTAIVTIVIFLVMITLHEFGHFIMAKTVGVKVLEFSVGMGPAIFKRQGTETLYSVRVFPIGGYCKLEGEDGDSDDPSAFSNQKLWKRFLVVSAGAVFNLILGFILFVIIVGMTGPFLSNTVGKVDERSYLAQSGVVAGDKIIAIDGHKINFYDDIALYTGEFSEDTEFDLTVKRNGEKLKFKLKPSVNVTTVTYDRNSASYTDTINGITEQYTRSFDEGVIPEAYIGKEVTTTRCIIGFEPLVVDVTARNILPQAWHYTGYIARSIFMALGEMFTGETGLDNVSGPVGVAGVVSEAVNSGTNHRESFINILFIVAMLTVNLGIFNLLPLPALDGGRLFFMLIELVRGKPVPPEKEGVVHAIGLLLLLALAVVICFNDILKLIG